jgi:hypothetical protein
VDEVAPSYGIKDMTEIWSHLADFFSNLLVVVVKDMLGTVGADQVSMHRAAGRHHFRAIERGELNGVNSNTCCDKSNHIDCDYRFSWHLQPPCQTSKVVP